MLPGGGPAICIWAGFVAKQNGFHAADDFHHLRRNRSKGLVQLFDECGAGNFLARSGNEFARLFHVEINVGCEYSQ